MNEIEKIKHLHKISTVLLSEQKPEKVLDAIVKGAADFFSADASSILLFDEKREYLTIARSYNLSRAYVKVVKVQKDEAIAGAVAKTGKPSVIPDLVESFKKRKDDYSVRWFRKEKLVSAVDAPVIMGKTALGCLNLYYRRKYTFRKKDLDVLKIFCDFSAIAIHNASLIKEIRNQLREKSALESIGIALTSTLELSKVLRMFISTAVEFANTEMGSIILVDEKEKRIQKAYNYYRRGKRLVSYLSTARLQKGISGKILRTKKPIAIRDISKMKGVNPVALEKGRKSVLGVPVMMQRKLIAILYVNSSRLRDFSKREISQISILANQAAVAIENARLYAQVEQKIRDISISYRISQTLISTLDLEALLLKILNEIKESFGYLNAAILLIDEDTNLLQMKAAKGYPEEAKNKRLQVGIDGITGYVAAKGKTYYCPDVTKDKHYVIGIENAKSEVAIPLKMGNRVIGVLDVETDEYDAFDEWEIKLLSSIAAQIGNSIEKSRLYEETKLLSLTDPLTELPNRRHFDIMMDAELRRSERYNRPLAVLLLDLDNFKRYNDENGHIAGDKILIEYAAIMKSSIRDIDLICRYGGDEFVVVLPETDEIFARAVGERIRKKVEKASKKMKITLSIGIASYPIDGDDKTTLINVSDKACYLAKRGGGNCVRGVMDRR
jgi:diguanylate cyclase (GGDEF)-like protein